METALFYAFGLFGCCVMIQIGVSRFCAVRQHLLWLITVFFSSPILATVAILLLPRFIHSLAGRFQWGDWALACLLHASLSLAYALLFTGIAGHSPSMAILRRVDDSMPRGLRRELLAPEWFTNENLSGIRHRNLIQLGLLVESHAVLRLTSAGQALVCLFVFFRRLLGLNDLATG